MRLLITAAMQLHDTLYVSERVSSAAPTHWQLFASVAGVGGFIVFILVGGIKYGAAMARIESLEKDRTKAAQAIEVTMMFASLQKELATMSADIARRLGRLESHFDREDNS